MTETHDAPRSLRSSLAVAAMVALVFGLLPLAPSAQAAPPNQRDGDATATTGEAETAQTSTGPIDFERQAGATRFQTAAQIAEARFSGGSNDVVIATGEDYADALAGAGLEGSLGAPVLLVPSTLQAGSIPSSITDAIDNLGATEATLLGGTDAISTGVENHIEDNSSVSNSPRVQGPTRFETAEEIAGQVSANPLPTDLADDLGLDDGDTAFLATGLEFADALAAGPGAYQGPHPTLLTPTSELHPAAERGLEDSGAENVIILGGTDAVGSAVETELNNAGYETARLSGADRWETATEVADAFADGFGFGVADVGLATGFEFADALASAPYLGEVPAPVVLTPSNSVNDQPLSWFEERGCDIETIHVFGGQVAVEDSVAEGYADAACPEDPAENGSISGTVTDAATGEPIDGAEVTASNAETFTATTDADGEYAMTVDAPETYTVTADADGYDESDEQEVGVEVDEDVDGVDFALEVTTNQTFSVTPDDEESNPTDGERDYEATGFGDVGEVTLELAEAANVTVDNGTVSFEADGDGNADFGDPAATIEDVTVDGTTFSGVGEGDSVEVDADSQVEFTVAGAGERESVVPAVYDGDAEGDLPVDGDGEPENPFGIGGQKHFVDVDLIDTEPTADLNPYGQEHTVTGTLTHNDGTTRYDNPDENWTPAELEGETIEFTVYDRLFLDGDFDPDPEAITAQQEDVAPIFQDLTQQQVEEDVCTFEEADQIPQGAVVTSGQATTDAEGSAEFAYTQEEPGPEAVVQDDVTMDAHCILAEWAGDTDTSYEGEEAHGSAYKAWSDEPREVEQVSLQPEEAFNEDVDGDHEVTATVVDQFGTPVEGAEVDFALDRQTDDALETDALTSTQTTDATGQASWTYPGPGEPAEDSITASVDDVDDDATATKHWIEAGVQNTSAGEWYGYSDGDLVNGDVWSPDPINDAIGDAADGDELRAFGTHDYFEGPFDGGAVNMDQPVTLTGDATIALADTGDGTPTIEVSAPGAELDGSDGLTVQRTESSEVSAFTQGVLVATSGAEGDAAITVAELTVNGTFATADATNAGIMVRSAGGDLVSGVDVAGNTVEGFASGIAVTESDGGDASDGEVSGVTVADNTVDAYVTGVIVGNPAFTFPDTPSAEVTGNDITAASDGDILAGMWLNHVVDDLSDDPTNIVDDPSAYVDDVTNFDNTLSGDEPFACVSTEHEDDDLAQAYAEVLAESNDYPDDVDVELREDYPQDDQDAYCIVSAADG